MAKAADAATQAMIDNLPAKTGRSLHEWLAFLEGREGEKHGALVAALKAQGVGHGFANLIVHTFREGGTTPSVSGPGGAAADELVEAQYAGKEGLRPIYEALVAAAKGFGGDVELAPKKGYVSLRRSTQFALVQPSTKTRLDLGLKIKGVEPEGRLEAAGSWNTMVTHRVKLESADEVDAQVRAWLRRAYETA
jgi:predicted transport protein